MLVNFQAHINEIVGKVLDSNQSVGSQRKANNFCNEQIKALSEERQRVSQPDPNCVSQEKNLLAKDPSYTTDLNQVAKQNCMQLSQERMIENINSMADSCRDISSVQSQLQNSQYLDVAIQMARANVNIAKNFFNQLAHQDCRSGVQTALCDGKSDGDFTALEKRYEAKFAQAQKYCPNLKSNKQSYLDNLRKNPGEVSHSALASSNNENAVKPEVQCNIFCRMYNKIASIFRS